MLFLWLRRGLLGGFRCFDFLFRGHCFEKSLFKLGQFYLFKLCFAKVGSCFHSITWFSEGLIKTISKAEISKLYHQEKYFLTYLIIYYSLFNKNLPRFVKVMERIFLQSLRSSLDFMSKCPKVTNMSKVFSK